jgi:glycosyltransferase involved in cell wall biosynthesis
MAHRRIAPLQVNMNIGVCLPIGGMDAIVYHNDVKAEADAATLAELGIAQHRVVTIGTDLRPCLNIVPTPRASLGVPEEAVLLACVANQVPKRLLFDGFIDGLIDCLKANPRVWWIGIGGGDATVLRSRFAEVGVADRCVLTGAVSDPRPLLATADILLNEYPEGGGNTVLESMGVGTPVLAMRAGGRHAESIGAILAGEFAAPERDRAGYWRQLQRWIDDPAERARVGAAMKDRAHREFDYAGIVRAYARVFTRESV